MGFFDIYTDTSAGGAYVGKDEKAELMEHGVAFPIVKVKLDEHPQHGTRYVASVLLAKKDDEGNATDEQEERLITFPFGTVESRDRMLGEMEKWLDDPANEPPLVKLEKVGRSIIIRPAA